jgi:hypothetical protein
MVLHAAWENDESFTRIRAQIPCGAFGSRAGAAGLAIYTVAVVATGATLWMFESSAYVLYALAAGMAASITTLMALTISCPRVSAARRATPHWIGEASEEQCWTSLWFALPINALLTFALLWMPPLPSTLITVAALGLFATGIWLVFLLSVRFVATHPTPLERMTAWALVSQSSPDTRTPRWFFFLFLEVLVIGAQWVVASRYAALQPLDVIVVWMGVLALIGVGIYIPLSQLNDGWFYEHRWARWAVAVVSGLFGANALAAFSEAIATGLLK